MPDKILFINQHAGIIGGLEKYIHATASLLRENGFRTACVYLEKVKHSEKFFSAFDEVWAADEIDKINAENFRLSTIHKVLDAEVLKKCVEKFAPTAFIHDHDYFCPKGYKYYPYKRINCERPFSRIPCGVCASIVPPRHITNGLCAMLDKNFIQSARLCSAIKKCPRFVVLSDFMKAQLVNNGIAAQSVNVIHPFLTSFRERKRPQNTVGEIVFAGQQVMSKGILLLLDAARQMKSDARIRILGTGPRFEYFKSVSSEMGLDGKVFFEGWVSNPDDYFAAADFAVFPSMWQEPFGLSGIEAMSGGIPVVGFDVGGVSEWLKDGENGILVPERDTAAMAAAFDKLLNDAALCEKLGARAAEMVSQNYTSQKFLENFKTLL